MTTVVCIKKHLFWISTATPPMNPPLTVIKMVHITITSFHTNLYANKSYLVDVNHPPRLYRHPQIQNPGKYTGRH